MCLHSTDGISSIISAGPLPAIVQDRVIDDLRQRECNGYIQLPKQKAFRVGDKVVVNAGAFAGQLGLVERMGSKERQKVLLALLGNQIKLLVNEDELVAA